MTVQTRPMRDRLGRAYTPAVGSRLRPLLWIILIGFAAPRRQWLLSVQRDRAHLVPGDDAANAILHVNGSSSRFVGPVIDRAVLDLRVRPSGDLVESAEQGGDSVRPGTPGHVAGDSGLGPDPGTAGGL